MAADNELPVWTIRPNWRNGILERLEWLTDVLGSTYGTEQRRALRLSPRRTFEMTFNPFNEARSYFDLWLHRMGSEEFMVPLFHDRGRITAAVTVGQGAIPVDTTFREFLAGGMAVIIGDDPFAFDVLEITAVADDELTVEAAGVTHGWPEGTAVYPLRRTRISQESLFAAITNRVGEAVLQFDLNQANDIPDEGAWALSYLGVPILLDKPNRRERMDFTYIRNSMILDNEQGLRALLDDAGRAFTMQTYLRQMRGRAEHWAFRQMLYRLRGQQAPIWLPTFNQDFELSRSRLAADTYLDIKKIGYAYTGGVVDGREHILINGATPLAGVISGVGAAPTTAEERLTLSGALGQALAAGVTGSFLEIVRLNQDSVEINHLTDTDGMAECNLTFRGFRDERTPGDVQAYPIEPAETRLVPCGIPAESFAFNILATSFGNATQSLLITMGSTEETLLIEKPLVSESDGALMWNAWSAWPSDGATSPGHVPVPGQNWNNYFKVYGINGGVETLIYEPVMSPNMYAGEMAAYEALADQMPVMLTGYEQYRIKPPYDDNPGDNRGGISLLITKLGMAP